LDRLIKDTRLAQVVEFHRYFNMPENRVESQFPSSESRYAWQHLSQYYPAARVARGGTMSELDVSLDESISEINFTGRDGVERTVSQYFGDMPLDAMIVMQDGKIVYERYKTTTPDTAHITMSSSKVFSSALLAMLEDEGKVDLSKPVSDDVPELKGSVWDTVLVRHSADMQVGLNATEHDEPTQDSRTSLSTGGWGADNGTICRSVLQSY
jgi:CubicO group peptidase (beta-lactamase class C family)